MIVRSVSLFALAASFSGAALAAEDGDFSSADSAGSAALAVHADAESADVTGRVFGPGANYLDVFRLAGTSAFLAYALALPQHSIWFRRRWRTTLLTMVDGLVYALLTAGAFGWLWPG